MLDAIAWGSRSLMFLIVLRAGRSISQWLTTSPKVQDQTGGGEGKACLCLGICCEELQMALKIAAALGNESRLSPHHERSQWLDLGMKG